MIKRECFLMSLLLGLKGTGSDWNVICIVFLKNELWKLSRMYIYIYIYIYIYTHTYIYIYIYLPNLCSTTAVVKVNFVQFSCSRFVYSCKGPAEEFSSEYICTRTYQLYLLMETPCGRFLALICTLIKYSHRRYETRKKEAGEISVTVSSIRVTPSNVKHLLQIYALEFKNLLT